MNESPEPPKQRPRLRQMALSLLLLLSLYLVSYAVLSFTGGWIVTEAGRWRPFGLAEIDCIQWQPRFGFCQRFVRSGSAIYDTELLQHDSLPLPWWGSDGEIIRADFLGILYAPLILLDQAHLHPTIPLWHTVGDPDSGVDASRVPPLEKWHPARVNPFAGRFPFKPAD